MPEQVNRSAREPCGARALWGRGLATVRHDGDGGAIGARAHFGVLPRVRGCC